MLEPGDRVLAALSGGLDSLVMLEVLLELQRRVPFEFELETVTFDPGFPDFNAERIAEYCAQKQVKHHLIKLDIFEWLNDPGDGRFRRPCVRCSRLRRGNLYRIAREQNMNKLSLGHHADDLLESFMISLLRGQGLTTMGPNVPADGNNAGRGSLRIIRPLATVPEAMVKRAAGNFEFPGAGACPYKAELDASGDRAWVKRMLADISQKIPDLRQLMLKSMKKVELPYLLDKRYLDFKSPQ